MASDLKAGDRVRVVGTSPSRSPRPPVHPSWIGAEGVVTDGEFIGDMCLVDFAGRQGEVAFHHDELEKIEEGGA